MFATCAALRCGVIAMHTRGLPSEWAAQPRWPDEDVLPCVSAGLRDRMHAATDAGVARERIVLDPGFGFGKAGTENWALLRDFESLRQLGRPLIVGLSRKGFLSPRGTPETAQERDDLTHTADTIAILAGTHLVRVHDVRGALRSATIADAVRQSKT